MMEFKTLYEAEGIHPLEGGMLRLKYRTDRRYGMPIEPMGVFHYKLLLETFKKLKIYGRLAWQGWRIGQKVLHDPKRHEYMDLALSPVVGSRQARPVRRDGGRRCGAQQAARRGSGARQGRGQAKPTAGTQRSRYWRAELYLAPH